MLRGPCFFGSGASKVEAHNLEFVEFMLVDDVARKCPELLTLSGTRRAPRSSTKSEVGVYNGMQIQKEECLPPPCVARPCREKQQRQRQD